MNIGYCYKDRIGGQAISMIVVEMAQLTPGYVVLICSRLIKVDSPDSTQNTGCHH